MKEEEFWDTIAYKISKRTAGIRLNTYHACTMNILGDIREKLVLDCGTGAGLSTLLLNQKGAKVVGCDLSFEMLKLTRERAKKVDLFKMGVERLGFKAEKFNFVLGWHILHHTKLKESVPELARILSPEGRAVFVENFAFNPIPNFARVHIASRFGIPRYGTKEEHPLNSKDLCTFRAYFNTVKLVVPEFLFMKLLARQVFHFKSKGVNFLCKAIDDWFYKSFKELRRYSYTQVLVLEK